MRFYCLLGSLLLIISVTDCITIKPKYEAIATKANNSHDHISNLVSSLRIKDGKTKHDSKRIRGVRGASYFETAGIGSMDKELCKDIDDPGGVKAEVVESMRIEGPRGNDDKSLGRDSPNKVNVRKERQVRLGSGAVRYQDKLEGDRNFNNLMKWNKAVFHSHPDSSNQLNSVQQNEAFPLNDDVSDFAMYMFKNRKRKPKQHLGLGSQYPSYKDDANIDDDLPHHETYNNFGGISEFNRNGGTNNIPLEDDLALTLSDPVMAQIVDKTENSDSLVNFMEPVSCMEQDGESDHSDRAHTSSVVSNIVREKVINLPEPLIYNSSHVVNSFVYTMIPFRSPLLNLLENDKHSKYIMIKIDPVLEPSKRILDATGSTGNNEYVLEKNIMMYIDKLIGSDHMEQSLSIESMPRSKKTELVNLHHNQRSFREINRNNNSHMYDNKIKSYSGQIS